MINIAGVISIVLFYVLILAVGIWAGRKKQEGNDSEEEVMLAGRSIGLFVGIFTMTGRYNVNIFKKITYSSIDYGKIEMKLFMGNKQCYESLFTLKCTFNNIFMIYIIHDDRYSQVFSRWEAGGCGSIPARSKYTFWMFISQLLRDVIFIYLRQGQWVSIVAKYLFIL